MIKNSKHKLFLFLKESITNDRHKMIVGKDIPNTILRFKKELRRKKISCRTNFFQPDPNDRFGDFGSLEVSIDMSCGRSKNMTKNSIEKVVRLWANRTGLNKFFNYSGMGGNGVRIDIEFDLKDKYVKMFRQNDIPIDVVDLDNGEKDMDDILPKHIRLL